MSGSDSFFPRRKMISCEFSVVVATLVLTILVSSSLGKDLPPVPSSSSSGDHENSIVSSSVVAEGDANTLAEALRVLERRKREASLSHQPYSAYRPQSRALSRYRYPLYKKRSYYTSSPDYYDDVDYEYDYGPSIFRERETGPKKTLISNGYFFDKKSKKSDLFAENKRASRNFPTVTRFFDTLDAIKNRYNRDYYSKNSGEDYYDLTRLYSPDYAFRHLTTRRKRSTTPDVAPSATAEDVGVEGSMDKEESEDDKIGKTNSTSSSSSSSSPSSEGSGSGGEKKTVDEEMLRDTLPPTLKRMDRRKRAFRGVSKYVDRNRLRREADNDFLTREYFKTLARSVGNKKKRMAYGRFEAPLKVEKKNNLDSFLKNPSMMHYVQEQLRETEEQIADDTERLLRNRPRSSAFDDPKAAMILSNSIAKLDALESLRKALNQLERLLEEDAIRKRAMSLVNGYDNNREMEKDKRRKSLRTADVEKRKDDIFQQLFNGNKREECPVLDRIILNCIAITEGIGDDAIAFLEPCMNHEICYMCGSRLDVSRHECDAILSSALEAGCSEEVTGTSSPSGGSLNCLSAAGDTFNALGDPSRYDNKGTCTHDPCVRELMDTR